MVHGVTAVAAALSDLRIFADIIVKPGKSDLTVMFADIIPDGETESSPITIGFDRLQKAFPVNSDPLVASRPSQEKQDILPIEFAQSQTIATQGVVTVVYLVANILSDVIHNKMPDGTIYDVEVKIKSRGLPIGAGLGSSAAFSVAVAGACIKLLRCIHDAISGQSVPPLPLPIDGWILPTETDLQIINQWAFAAEVLNHGAPSGLDNATSCFGGLVKFCNSSGGQSAFEKIPQKPSLFILLTNTKVPRSTKALVASVKEMKEKMPDIVSAIFQAIEYISKRFISLVENPDSLERAKNANKDYAETANLININHSLLVSLGVSHPSLELVQKESLAAGFSCKLTGAGGGGCAITLLPAMQQNSSQEESLIAELMAKLINHGFDTFQSAIAGDGIRWHEGNSV